VRDVLERYGHIPLSENHQPCRCGFVDASDAGIASLAGIQNTVSTHDSLVHLVLATGSQACAIVGAHVASI
jgi:hypothetical protein